MSRLSLNRKPIKLLVVFTIAFSITFPAFFSHQVVAAQADGYFNKSFAWDYNGQHWTWNLSIPQALYDAYKSVPASFRTQSGPAGYGYLATTNDYYMRILAQKLNETATQQQYSSFDQVSFVLAFVQSLPYTSDSVTTGHDEYPRFPIETLVDDGGDCEDTSILFATLTLTMGYGTVFINPPDHYAVGILGNNLHGTYWTYNNKTYYYCETTGNGFKIGELPDEFKGQSAYIYPIDESAQFVPNVEIIPTVEPTPTDAPSTSTPAPILGPTPSASPTIAQPTVQPVLPLSFNLISEQPILFVIILLAIVLSILLAVGSLKRPKRTQSPPSQPVTPLETSSSTNTPEGNTEDSKFCIYCGSSNKVYAAYCERCGKKIS